MKEMDFETRKFACEALAANIKYRRERRWLVFSWSSSILIAMVGGVFALANSTGVDLNLLQRIMLSVAATTVTVCATLWIRRGSNYQIAEQRTLDQYYVEFGMPPMRHAPLVAIGTRFTLFILLLGTLATIWFTHPGAKVNSSPTSPSSGSARATSTPN